MFGADRHAVRVLDEQVVFVGRPEGVAGDDDAAGVVEVDVHLHVAEDVAGDGDVAVALFVGALDPRSLGPLTRMFAEPAALWLCWMVQPVMATSAFEPPVLSMKHVRGRRAVLALVALDVAAGDLEVADLARPADDPAAVAVADVAAGHVDLVQVDRVEEDADAAVLDRCGSRRSMTLRLRPVRWMPCRHLRISTRVMVSCIVPLASMRVGLLVVADDLEPVHRRHPLAGPHSVLHRLRVGGAGVSADELERRPLAGHHDARDAIAPDRDEAGLGQVDDDRLG